MIRGLLLVALCWSSTVLGNTLEPVENLQQLARQHPNKVVLLLISQPGCGFCQQITDDILQPMLISGDYDAHTVIREVEIYNARKLIDFFGRTVDATDFAKRYNAWATPTLLFLNGQGVSLAQKMVGYNTPDLYGYYVDESLSKARATNTAE